MPVFGIPFSRTMLDLTTVFGREAPTILEIGFGMGETTAEIAAANPDRNYIGVEVHTPGVGALLKRVDALGLRNLRVIEHDVQEVLDFQIPDGSLTAVHVFFPDPWPKARHHKRRLIQKQFVNKLARKLSLGGHLHLATDWPAYAAQMTETLGASEGFVLVAEDARPGAAPPALPTLLPPARPVTKFERRGMNLGHPIADLVAVRSGSLAVATM